MTEFIKMWETQLDIAWDLKNDFTFISDEGPHLSLLPGTLSFLRQIEFKYNLIMLILLPADEFLPSLDKYLCQLKNSIDKVINNIPSLKKHYLIFY